MRCQHEGPLGWLVWENGSRDRHTSNPAGSRSRHDPRGSVVECVDEFHELAALRRHKSPWNMERVRDFHRIQDFNKPGSEGQAVYI